MNLKRFDKLHILNPYLSVCSTPRHRALLKEVLAFLTQSKSATEKLRLDGIDVDLLCLDTVKKSDNNMRNLLICWNLVLAFDFHNFFHRHANSILLFPLCYLRYIVPSCNVLW